MVRNGLSIHHGAIGGDPDGHVMNNCMPIPRDRTFHAKVNMYHYGHARSKSCYIKKQNTIDKRYNPSGINQFKEIPEDKYPFVPSDKLKRFYGKHPYVMKDRVEVGTSSHEQIVDLYTK
jgi:hypothetical protein